MMTPMPSPTRSPPSPPLKASRRKDLLPIENVDLHPASFPKVHHLVVTTSKGVSYWTSEGVQEVFHSGSEGIVAAKKSRDASGLIAVADSQVVVLHDTRRALEKSYRLKGTDGQVRLLKYANDSKSLLFTTTLQNSVQSYSITQSKLLDPSHEHPSPPTCFALSPSSRLLLSASANPKIVYLHNLSLRTRPILLKPSVSSAAVIVASFHPQRANIFLLGFEDGTLACYDATKLLNHGGKGDRKLGAAITGQGTEISYLKNVHASGMTKVSSNPDIDIHNSASNTHAPSISAAAFVPGSAQRVVSVGADGKCCLVDFENGNQKRGKLTKTWHVRAPATCLSILWLSEVKDISKVAPSISSLDDHDNERLIAIGRVDGKVVLYDLEGNLLGEKTIDAKGGRILDVEWMPGPGDVKIRNRKENVAVTVQSDHPTATKRGSSVTDGPTIKTKNQSLTSALAASHSTTEGQAAIPSPEPQVVDPRHNEESKEVIDNLSERERAQALPHDIMTAPMITYMNLFSPIKAHSKPQENTTPSNPSSSPNPAISSPQLWTSVASFQEKRKPPPIPPRPTPRKQRRVSIRKASTSVEFKAEHKPSSEPSKRDDGKLLAGLRSISGEKGGAGKGKGLSLFAPYMQKAVIKDSQAITSQERAVRNNTSSTVPQLPISNPNYTTKQEEQPTPDIWLTDTEGTAIIPPPRKSSRKSLKSPAKIAKTRKGRKTVSFEEDEGNNKKEQEQEQEQENRVAQYIASASVSASASAAPLGFGIYQDREEELSAMETYGQAAPLAEGSGNGRRRKVFGIGYNMRHGNGNQVDIGDGVCKTCGRSSSDAKGIEDMRKEMKDMRAEIQILKEEIRKGFEGLQH